MTLHPDVGHGLITASTQTLLLSHPDIPVVHAELRYYCEDPLAVHLVLSIDQGPAGPGGVAAGTPAVKRAPCSAHTPSNESEEG